MTSQTRARMLCVMSVLLGGVAFAQGAATTPATPNAVAPVAPSNDSIDPAVDTSANPRPAAPTSSSAAAEKPDSGKPDANAKPVQPRGKVMDRLELDTTQITGNRELPKVLYIVPWKRSDLGDLIGKPVNSLLDEVLAPVDRDVFQRQNRYYDALQPTGEAAAAGRGTATGSAEPPK